MSDIKRVLVVGATGMLGRPVVRRLIEEGFVVRALARDVDRARTLLPAACQIVRGDVRDDALLLAALDGCDQAYINLSEPMVKRPPPWSIEVEGTRAVVAACRACGVRRVMRISAMGVDDAADQWWAAKCKRDADRALMESDVEWTVVRPTWLMESLCTLRIGGGLMLCPDLPQSPLRWISGDDYARQVAAAFQSTNAIRKVYQPQGPENLTIRQAVKRFCAAWRNDRRRIMSMPIWPMRMGRAFSGRSHYLTSLLDMTRDHFSRIDREAISTDLPAARMTIEDYARYVERTGDWPRK